MGDITTLAGNRHSGSVRSKKLSTKVDFTPMVDLGFLLITFFIVTTKLAEPKSMKLFLPKDGDFTMIGESISLTLIPFNRNKIFYYQGDLKDELQSGLYGSTDYSISKGIGELIRQKQAAMDEIKPNSRKDLFLIIKPSQSCSYANIVDLMDEVHLNDIQHNALVDLDQTSLKLFSSLVK